MRKSSRYFDFNNFNLKKLNTVYSKKKLPVIVKKRDFFFRVKKENFNLEKEYSKYKLFSNLLSDVKKTTELSTNIIPCMSILKLKIFNTKVDQKITSKCVNNSKWSIM